MNLALFLLSALLCSLGLLAFAMSRVKCDEDEEPSLQSQQSLQSQLSQLSQLSQNDEQHNRIPLRSSLSRHPAVPPSLARSYPFFVLSTMILFVFSDLGLGTVVNMVFRAGDDVTTIGPAFSFSVLTLSRDSIKGVVGICLVGC